MFTPGDNDSTDCDRPSNGGFNSLERLEHEATLLRYAVLGRSKAAATRRAEHPLFAPGIRQRPGLGDCQQAGAHRGRHRARQPTTTATHQQRLALAPPARCRLRSPRTSPAARLSAAPAAHRQPPHTRPAGTALPNHTLSTTRPPPATGPQAFNMTIRSAPRPATGCLLNSPGFVCSHRRGSVWPSSSDASRRPPPHRHGAADGRSGPTLVAAMLPGCALAGPDLGRVITRLGPPSANLDSPTTNSSPEPPPEG
jgi:hypothetical protein